MRPFGRFRTLGQHRDDGRPAVEPAVHAKISPLAGLLLSASLVAGALVAVSIVALGLANGTGLGHVSGVWTAMAMDFRDGLFYRPLYDPAIGTGGTRFFPAVFVSQAALASLGGTLVGAGHVVGVGGGILLLGGLVALMRRLGGGWLLCATLAVLFSCTSTLQLGLVSIRGDVLPLACNLIGLAVFLTALPSRPRETLSAALFTTGFAAKMTAVHGPVALCLWLFAHGRVKEATRLCLLTAVGYAGFVALLVAGTSGRILDILEVSALGGGTLDDAFNAPIAVASRLMSNDPVSLVLTAVAAACFAIPSQQLRTSLPGTLFAASVIITTAQFMSPGIAYNHFIDLAAASLLLIGATHVRLPLRGNAPATATAISVTAATLWNVSVVSDEWATYTAGRSRYPDELVQRIAASDGPVISENPFLPLLAGRSPFVLDPFMLRVVLQQNPDIERELLRRVERREFPLIVLQNVPSDAPRRYETVHFGAAFVKLVTSHYQLDRTVTSFAVFVPRPVTPQELGQRTRRDPGDQ